MLGSRTHEKKREMTLSGKQLLIGDKVKTGKKSKKGMSKQVKEQTKQIIPGEFPNK